MKISLGIIVVGVAMLLFYVRIAILRGRKKRYEREFALKRRKVSGRSKGAVLPTPEPGSPPFGVTSWVLVAVSMIVILAGVVMYNDMTIFGITFFEDSAFAMKIVEFWYIPVAVGVLALSFCFKIDKPQLDEV